MRAIYPGSFDPVTNGHLDLIQRARALFDEVIVVILNNPRKVASFPLDERLAMLEELLGDGDDIRVMAFDGLLVQFARDQGAQVIVRGLRAVSDFELEFQMALMNRQLAEEIETLFMVPREDYTYVSSSLIKEISSHGGSVEGLVPPLVEDHLRGLSGKSDDPESR